MHEQFNKGPRRTASPGLKTKVKKAVRSAKLHIAILAGRSDSNANVGADLRGGLRMDRLVDYGLARRLKDRHPRIRYLFPD